MQVQDVKGMIVLEFEANNREQQKIKQMSEQQIVEKGKQAAVEVLGSKLVTSAIVGLDNGTIRVAIAV